MNSEQAFSLVDQIYEAALNVDQWPDLLCHIADASRLENAALVVIDPAMSYSAVLSPRSDPQVAAAYNDYWWQHDPTADIASRFAVGRITTLADTGKDRFLASAFHNEFWRHSGLGAERMAANLFAQGDAFSSLVLQPSARRDFIDTDAMQAAAFLVPHIARAVTISRKVHRLELEQAVGNQASPPDQCGLIVVDRDGRCLHADKAGENLMQSGGVVTLERGAVKLRDDKANERYKCALQAFSQGGAAFLSGSPIQLDHAPDEAQLELEIQPLQTAVKDMVGKQAIAKLVFRQCRPSGAAQRQGLRRQFGLTPAEAALAIEMLKGDGRAAAASRCGISVNTARTHLTRIFEKTGVKRQAELIRVVMDHLR